MQHTVRFVLELKGTMSEVELYQIKARLVRGVGRVISWQKARYHVIYLMLTNPMYAGIYAYGRRQAQVDPLAHTRQVHRKARADWEVFLPEHHPGYIRKAGIRSQRGHA
jgi:Recombinase